MRYREILEACWTGYRKAGMKKKGDRMVPNCVPVSEQELEEDLKKWFKEKWVRFGPDGKIRGDCARGDDSEGKPKCLPQSKAHSLGKKGRASAAAKKRREDPNPERRGAAKNVATRVKEDARSESEQQHGWRAELVDEISPITFEVRLTNRRSRESANFVVRPADLIRLGMAGKLTIDSIDIQDLQTGATRSIVTDDPAPWVYILDAVDALFHDTPALQARLQTQLKAYQDKDLPMLPGLKKREHAGQGIAVKDFVQGQQAAKDAVARAQGKKDKTPKVSENEVQDLEKVLQNPHSYNAIDHMMQSIAKKSKITAKQLHDRFVAKHNKTPDDWIKNKGA
jgi:hypothetical protein